MMTLSEIMTEHPFTLGPQNSVKQAMDLMQQERIRHIPIVDEHHHLLGLVTLSDILATRENEVLATVSGQIVRSGIFQEKAFAEAFNFKLSLRLLRNPNMATNGRFPTAVADFRYEVTP